MTAKLDYRWRLRQVMAERGMFSTTALRPLLAERGIDLSPSQVYRLVAEKPERLNLKVLIALLDLLGCEMTDLIEPVAARERQRRKRTAATAGHLVAAPDKPGVGALRPKRARILPDA